MRRTLLIVLAQCWLVATVQGAVIYDSSAVGELTGSRTTPGTSGITGQGTFSPMTISWTITNPSTGVYHYQYSIVGPTGGGLGVSHFILDFSDSCFSGTSLADPNCIYRTDSTTSVARLTLPSGAVVNMTLADLTLGDQSSGNPNFPGSIIGIRFTGGWTGIQLSPTIATILEFDSNRPPVYGDFYIKLGQGGPTKGGGAWNNGAADHTSSVLLDFIPRPDGDTPEPGTIALLGGGLAVLAYRAFRKRALKS